MRTKDWSKARTASEQLSDEKAHALKLACDLALSPVSRGEDNRFAYLDNVLRGANWEPVSKGPIIANILRSMAYSRSRLKNVSGVESGKDFGKGYKKLSKSDFDNEFEQLERFVLNGTFEGDTFLTQTYMFGEDRTSIVVVMATGGKVKTNYFADVSCLFSNDSVRAAVQTGLSDKVHQFAKPFLNDRAIVPFSGQHEYIARDTPDGMMLRTRRNDWGRKYMDYHERSFEMEIRLERERSQMTEEDVEFDEFCEIYLRGADYSASG